MKSTKLKTHKFLTETESDSHQSPKRKSPLKEKDEKEDQQSYLRFIIRGVAWVVIACMVLVGHFYCALFMIWSASYFYRETLTLSRVLIKDQQIAFHWLDWYWYSVGVYVCIPYAFNRNKIHTIESKTIQFFLY